MAWHNQFGISNQQSNILLVYIFRYSYTKLNEIKINKKKQTLTIKPLTDKENEKKYLD